MLENIEFVRNFRFLKIKDLLKLLLNQQLDLQGCLLKVKSAESNSAEPHSADHLITNDTYKSTEHTVNKQRCDKHSLSAEGAKANIM